MVPLRANDGQKQPYGGLYWMAICEHPCWMALCVVLYAKTICGCSFAMPTFVLSSGPTLRVPYVCLWLMPIYGCFWLKALCGLIASVQMAISLCFFGIQP